MLFNSLSFALFLPIVFFLYWFLARKNFRIQNMLLLASSYYFYGSWDYRFLFLLAFSTLLDYYSGLKIHDARTPTAKKIWLWISIAINLGFLGLFKYYNFFVDSFANVLTALGFQPNIWTLNIILPIGISFYTFHGLSYVIDVYKGRITPVKNFIEYSVFVSYFPLLVAGPIERATHLLPQIQKPRVFNYARAVDGLRQILWGLFKKVVIADNCAEFADSIFNNSTDHSGSMLLVGAMFFAMQIYCDFSGYSDIALGTSRLFGIELLRNFAFPYFSRDIAEFWRRWHISLSSWFKDYLYIPLGGSSGGTSMKIRNTFIIFLVSGFWHGANWTFIVWGALNALYFLPLLLLKTNRNHMEIVAQGRMLPTPKEAISMTTTFLLTVLAWIFFRAENLSHAFQIIGEIFSATLFQIPDISKKATVVIVLVVAFMTVEWIGRERKYAIEMLAFRMPRLCRWAFYALLVFGIGMYMQTNETPFIYFQF